MTQSDTPDSDNVVSFDPPQARRTLSDALARYNQLIEQAQRDENEYALMLLGLGGHLFSQVNCTCTNEEVSSNDGDIIAFPARLGHTHETNADNNPAQ